MLEVSQTRKMARHRRKLDLPGMVESVEKSLVVERPVGWMQSFLCWTRCVDFPNKRKGSVDVCVPRDQAGAQKCSRRECGSGAEKILHQRDRSVHNSASKNQLQILTSAAAVELEEVEA